MDVEVGREFPIKEIHYALSHVDISDTSYVTRK